jgi:hypothetical protein
MVARRVRMRIMMLCRMCGKQREGWNPNNAADRNTVVPNGYTNLENYLSGV